MLKNGNFSREVVCAAVYLGILGVPGTGIAANPFSDVPRQHWAYKAIEKLSETGIAKGYPDGTFQGNRILTRYEMAQIVARALARGDIQSSDPLVSEFSDELDALGIRLAHLEKNADHVQITGNAQLSYVNYQGSAFQHDASPNSIADLRTRLFITGDVNEQWDYSVMLENNQYFRGTSETGDDVTDFQRLHLDGRAGAVKITAGRYEEVIGRGNVYDDNVDGIHLEVDGGNLRLTAAFGKVANTSNVLGYDKAIADEFEMVELDQEWGKWTASAAYSCFHDIDIAGGMQGNDTVWTAGLDYKSGKLDVNAFYLHGDNEHVERCGSDHIGYVFSAQYGKLDTKRTGSWNLYGSYYHEPAPTVLSHTMNGQYRFDNEHGFKGYLLGGAVTVAPNTYAIIEYFDLEGLKNGEKGRTLWTELDFDF